MSYNLLSQDLWDTAEFAKKHFAKNYGATKFKCEAALNKDLPLQPTWHAKTRTGYIICIETRGSPFSQSLYGFVARCAQDSVPVKLWVAVKEDSVAPGFGAELKLARNAGIGVVQFDANGVAHEYHRATPLSLYGLKKTDISSVPKCRRDVIKSAEATFLEGSPGPGCQEICQELELVTREFAEHTHDNNMWKSKNHPSNLKFSTDAWATVLEALEGGINEQVVKARVPAFKKLRIVEVRAYTEWRNSVSHKPKTLAALTKRDSKLRTMFEATRDLLVEWWSLAKPFGLVK